MKHLVIGLGEVGKAIREVLSCDGIGPGETAPRETYDVLDICFPWSDRFVQSVRQYQQQYRPGYTVIHSTVPVGVSRSLSAHHSPIRGKHPDLYRSVLTFTKYISGPEAPVLAGHYAQYGIPVCAVPNQEDTEAMKLWDTTYYYWNVHFMRQVKAYCDRKGLDFSWVYTHANHSYNHGYQEMGMPQFTRPVLTYQPGPTGGHCLVPNAVLLNTELSNYLLSYEPTKNPDRTGNAGNHDTGDKEPAHEV